MAEAPRHESGDEVPASVFVLLANPHKVQNLILKVGHPGFRSVGHQVKYVQSLLKGPAQYAVSIIDENGAGSADPDTFDALRRVMRGASEGNPLALEMVKFYLEEAHQHNQQAGLQRQ